MFLRTFFCFLFLSVNTYGQYSIQLSSGGLMSIDSRSAFGIFTKYPSQEPHFSGYAGIHYAYQVGKKTTLSLGIRYSERGSYRNDPVNNNFLEIDDQETFRYLEIPFYATFKWKYFDFGVGCIFSKELLFALRERFVYAPNQLVVNKYNRIERLNSNNYHDLGIGIQLKKELLEGFELEFAFERFFLDQSRWNFQDISGYFQVYRLGIIYDLWGKKKE